MPEPTQDRPSELRAHFEELTLPLTRMLYGAAMRWTGSPEDAADLVQETYLRAYRTFSNWQEGDVTCVLASDIDPELLIELAVAKAMKAA